MFFYGSNPGTPGPWGRTIWTWGEHHLNKLGKGPQHGLELTVASGKFATNFQAPVPNGSEEEDF